MVDRSWGGPETRDDSRQITRRGELRVDEATARRPLRFYQNLAPADLRQSHIYDSVFKRMGFVEACDGHFWVLMRFVFLVTLVEDTAVFSITYLNFLLYHRPQGFIREAIKTYRFDWLPKRLVARTKSHRICVGEMQIFEEAGAAPCGWFELRAHFRHCAQTGLGSTL
jgi:hypothetical protein